MVHHYADILNLSVNFVSVQAFIGQSYLQPVMLSDVMNVLTALPSDQIGTEKDNCSDCRRDLGIGSMIIGAAHERPNFKSRRFFSCMYGLA